jgi:hypothetical protein
MPNTTFQQAKDSLRESALNFGHQLRRWRLAQGWSQETAQLWGQEANIPHVYSSQWSMLETGAAKNPGPLTFRCLGHMNHLLALREYGNVTTRALRDRLQGAEPICHPGGRPWTAADFFAAYLGQIAWPDFPDVPELAPFTADEAAAWSEQFRRWFHVIARSAGRTRTAAASQLLEMVPPEEAEDFEEVLFGADYKSTHLDELRRPDGTPAPVVWLRDWAEAAGVESRLSKTRSLWPATSDDESADELAHMT